jgi:hypothetical protein
MGLDIKINWPTDYLSWRDFDFDFDSFRVAVAEARGEFGKPEEG